MISGQEPSFHMPRDKPKKKKVVNRIRLYYSDIPIFMVDIIRRLTGCYIGLTGPILPISSCSDFISMIPRPILMDKVFSLSTVIFLQEIVKSFKHQNNNFVNLY